MRVRREKRRRRRRKNADRRRRDSCTNSTPSAASAASSSHRRHRRRSAVGARISSSSAVAEVQIKPDDHCRNDCRSGRKSESSSPILTAFGGVPSLSSFPVYSDYVVVVLVTVWRRLLVAQTTVLLLLPNRSTKNAIRPRTTPLRNLTLFSSYKVQFLHLKFQKNWD